MPTDDDHDQQRNDFLYLLRTQSQPSFTHDSPFSLSTSPIASRQDPFPYYASNASSSGQAYASSIPAEEPFDTHIYNRGYSGSTVYSDIGWTLSGMVDSSGDATQYPPALEHCWSPVNETFTSSSDLAFRSSDTWEPDRSEVHVEAILSPWNMERSHRNTSSSWDPPAWNPSCSIPESSHGESSFYVESPISSNLDEQSVYRLCCDSAGLDFTAVQHSDSQISISPAYHEVFPGFLREDVYSPDFSETHGIPSHTWHAKPEAQTPQTEASPQPCYDVAGIEGTGSRPACSQCRKKFSHGADLTRHMRTQHGEAGRGYRCAFAGCSKVHKVWSRLDSFKKHVKKQHQIENTEEINGLVVKSATKDHGLPIAMTSLFRLHADSSASRFHHSVSL